MTTTTTTPIPTPDELARDPWAFGPWCWVVGEVRILDAPIPCRGMHQLWATADRVREGRSLRDVLRSELGVDVPHGLTLLQPYASAISHGPKRIENRPWRRHVPAGGRWIALQAGKALHVPKEERRNPDAFVEGMLDDWRTDGESPMWPGAPTLAELPRGVVLGAMRIDAILRYPDTAQTRTGGS